MSKITQTAGAMGFFHSDGFVPSYRQAAAFAGKTGHVGTLLDIVDARLATPPKHLDGFDPSNPTPWDQYYTSMSAEYVGQSKGGVKILIVAHGIGPMSTERGVVEAYKWESADKSRNRRGGRITSEEFHKLEGGYYGSVEIVEFEPYLERYRYPFGSILRASEAFSDPVIRARLGNRTIEYLTEHTRLALKFYSKEYLLDPTKQFYDPFIIKAEDPGNCNYVYRKVEDGYAFAHLLSIGQIVQASNRNDYGDWPTWSCDVGPYEWWNGTRMFGVQERGATRIHKGPDASQLLQKHWRELMEPSGLDSAPDGLNVIMEMPDKTWFTQVPKKGAQVDTYQPEFLVTSMEKVGEPQRFYTESNYPVPIFRYDRCEAQAVLPQGVNAYTLVGEPSFTNGVGSRETCLVQGYRIKFAHTRRLIGAKALANDFDRMMQLLQTA